MFLVGTVEKVAEKELEGERGREDLLGMAGHSLGVPQKKMETAERDLINCCV